MLILTITHATSKTSYTEQVVGNNLDDLRDYALDRIMLIEGHVTTTLDRDEVRTELKTLSPSSDEVKIPYYNINVDRFQTVKVSIKNIIVVS